MSDGATIASRYDENAERYDDATRYNRDAAVRLVAALPARRYGSLLDVACGTGYAALAMVERFGPLAVTGVDVSAQMLERMRAKLAAHPGVRVDLHVADVLAMPVPDAAFDCVLASMALHWFPDRAAAVAAMARTVAPGGILGLVAPGPGHDREYVEVLEGIVPPVPAPVIDIFATAQVFPDEVEGYVEAQGLEVVDVWMETRRRRVPPDRYMSRITTVGSHVWHQIMPPDEVEAMIARITDAVHAAAGPRGFEYTFTKAFAVARRPG